MASETNLKAVISGSQQGPVSKPADGPPVETGWAVNLRFLVWSLTASGLILAALAVWYHHQVRRHADALLERARGLYEYFVSAARSSGIPTETGKFQAMMAVHLINDGPVTLICESPPR